MYTLIHNIPGDDTPGVIHASLPPVETRSVCSCSRRLLRSERRRRLNERLQLGPQCRHFLLQVGDLLVVVIFFSTRNPACVRGYILGNPVQYKSAGF